MKGETERAGNSALRSTACAIPIEFRHIPCNRNGLLHYHHATWSCTSSAAPGRGRDSRSILPIPTDEMLRAELPLGAVHLIEMNATADPRCSTNTRHRSPLQHGNPIGILGRWLTVMPLTLRASRILVEARWWIRPRSVSTASPSEGVEIHYSSNPNRSRSSPRARNFALDGRRAAPQLEQLAARIVGASPSAFAWPVVALAYVWLGRVQPAQRSRMGVEEHSNHSAERPESRKSRSVLPQAGHRSGSPSRDERAGRAAL